MIATERSLTHPPTTDYPPLAVFGKRTSAFIGYQEARS